MNISNADKRWWPDDGLTKLDVARYYSDVADLLIPWTNDRPLVAERCPEGLAGSCFFQKNFAGRAPGGVPRATIAAESVGRDIDYLVGGSARTVLEMVNLGCIAVHVMNCRVGTLDQPDWLAFDLDPSSGRFAEAAQAALFLHEVLEGLGLASFPKTSGGRGVHVFVPLRAGHHQEQVRMFARAVGGVVSAHHPQLVTTAVSKRSRRGRVYFDTLRNAFGHTIVTPYSLRRRPRATVSTPLAWEEVDPRLDPTRFNLRSIPDRLGGPDPWAGFWRRRQALPGAAPSTNLTLDLAETSPP